MTKATNYSLEVAKEEEQKREEMLEKRRTEAIATKCQRAKGGTSLSSEKKGNYKSDTGDETYLDKSNDKYPLSNCKAMDENLQVASKIVWSYQLHIYK